jgi:thiosulfate reductase cytochrome b subunit
MSFFPLLFNPIAWVLSVWLLVMLIAIVVSGRFRRNAS